MKNSKHLFDAMQEARIAANAVAKTNAQRQAAFRARKAQEAIIEVRGIFAHQDDHAEVKEAAAKIARRRQRLAKRAATSGADSL